jgi:diguanylate cyclase (GGDEF)-like protein
VRRSENRLNLDTAKIDAKNAEAYRLRSFDPDRAQKICNDTLSNSKQLGYRRGEADALRTLGTLVSQQDREAGFDYAERAVTIYREIGDEYGECSALMTLSLYYHHKGLFHRAHMVLTEAHEKAARSGNLYVSGIALFNLGVNAEEREDLLKALEYFEHAKVAAERGANDTIFWASTIAVASTSFELGGNESDLEALRTALVSLMEAGSYNNAIDACLAIAKISFANGQTLPALLSLRKGMRIAVDNQRPYMIWALQHFRGKLQFQRGRPLSAKRAYKAALRTARVSGNRVQESKTMEQLAEVYRNLGNAEKAFDMLHEQIALKREIFSEDSERRLREMQSIHQVQLVEAESRLLKSKNVELAAINDRLEMALREREQLQQELERMATIDELTGVLNRRRILAIGTDFVARFHAQGRPGVVLVVDIDNFKSINDNYGHPVGDEVLRRFTQSCQRVLRPTDFLGRLGGEEFCILLDRTDMEIAHRVAERVLASIRTTRVDDLMTDRIVTASIGMSEVKKHHDTIATVLHDADLGLYEAKRTGRDRMCIGKPEKPKAA